jgi:tetratricopeptide (TPR) repeat protein
LIALRRTSDAIAQLAATFPGWRPWLGYARAALHQQRAELPAARAELEAALVLAQPGEHRAWTRLAPAHAELLLQLGDADAALRECDAMLEAVARLGLDQWTAVTAQRIRALALSARGEHPAAHEALEAAFALAIEQLYGGLPLALLYAARAKIALAAGLMSECSAALEELRGLIELADAPALVHAYEAVREQSSRQLAGSDLPAPLTSSTIVVSQTSTTFSDVRTRLATCNERRERWRQALELVLEDSGAAGGHLFLFDANGLFPAASFPGSADQGTLLMAQHFLETQRDETKTAAVDTAELAPRRGTATEEEGKIVPALLAETVEGRRILTGVALLSTRAGNVRMPRAALMQAISRCLQTAGDSVPLAIDD